MHSGYDGLFLFMLYGSNTVRRKAGKVTWLGDLTTCHRTLTALWVTDDAHIFPSLLDITWF